MLYLLFDADMLVFESCSSVAMTVQWDEDLWSLFAHSSDAKAQCEDRIADIINSVLDKTGYEGEYRIILAFSDTENFRKKILSTYKANRIGKMKPMCYADVKKYLEERYDCCSIPTLEADDVIGLLATTFEGEEIHISGDKDYKTIRGVFYDFIHGDLYNLSKEDADYWFYMQCLVGDTADNYSGCKGIGAKTAEKLLTKEGATWETVLKAYSKAMTAEDARVQGAIARILRREDLDTEFPWTLTTTLWRVGIQKQLTTWLTDYMTRLDSTPTANTW